MLGRAKVVTRKNVEGIKIYFYNNQQNLFTDKNYS